ncbi:hypothetical protein KAR91_50365 [Candidatus Pacearchaeota archaeon]|nr:hypothetical protein [Candidatus Pacearchaeota archaeon]
MKWKFNRRMDRHGLIEYVCDCGVGHPIYASALWVAESIHGADDPDIDKKAEAKMIHGCCGCCSRDDFPGDMVTSLKKAHSIIRHQNKQLSAQDLDAFTADLLYPDQGDH